MSEKKIEKTDSEEKTFTIEENFSRIEEMMEQMEQQDISLEEAFALYQQGMERLKDCHRLLDTVEKKMQVISGGETEDFA